METRTRLERCKTVLVRVHCKMAGEQGHCRMELGDCRKGLVQGHCSLALVLRKQALGHCKLEQGGYMLALGRCKKEKVLAGCRQARGHYM